MARVLLPFALLALLAASPAMSRTLAQEGAAGAARWCIPAAADAADVAACTAAVGAANAAGVTFSCVAGGSQEACLQMISRGQADLVTLGAATMLEANSQYKLEPLVAEYYGDLQGASYYSVAVVPAAFCTAGASFASLKGKRSCHTGYRKTAGWNLPVGYLVESGVIPTVNADAAVNADAESVAAFFSSTCAPSDRGALTSGAQGTWEGMCSGCGNATCTTASIYYDYPGSMRCLMEGAGDVAFTKHTSPLEYTRDGTEPQPWSSKNKADLRLLCPSGGCQPLDNFEACNIAKAPATAVLSTAAFRSSATGKSAQAALVAAGGNATLLQSLRAWNGIADFPLSEDAQGLLAINSPFLDYFSTPAREAYEGVRSLESAAPTPSSPAAAAAAISSPAAPSTAATTASASGTTARWCIPFAANQAAVQACTAAAARANSGSLTFTCVVGGSQESCLELISKDGADMIVLGGSEMLPANEQYGLEPIAAEYYGDLQGASYYSVAVVPAAFCTSGASFASLKGKRSCHTGYRRTAGWTLPVGYLVESGVIPRVDGNAAVQADAESVVAFFSGGVCAPGSNNDGPRLGGGAWDGLCSACGGDCSPEGPFADYDGTLRCIMEGAGDVAFTKHTIPLEVASDGTRPQAWSKLSKADLRLLCPSGGCQPLDQYESCNLAKAPARAVMVRADLKSSPAGQAVQQALVAGGSALVEAMTNIGGEEGFVFGETAQSLLAVDVPFTQYFGQSTKLAYEGITSLDQLAASGAAASTASAAAAPSSGGGGGGGVSSGAAVGIGIGCAAAGALLGGLAMALYAKKRRGSWQPHLDERPLDSAREPSNGYKL